MTPCAGLRTGWPGRASSFGGPDPLIWAGPHTPYFLVYGPEAILPADIAFRAPRVEHYNEEEATTVRTEDVDRAEEEHLITCIRTAKSLEGLRRYYNRNIKGRSFAVGDLILRRK